MGHQVDFLVTDSNDGKETFYEYYEEALKHDESMAED
jgi:hypothetical protein